LTALPFFSLDILQVVDFHRDAERVQKGLYQNMIDAKQKGVGNDRGYSKTVDTYNYCTSWREMGSG